MSWHPGMPPLLTLDCPPEFWRPLVEVRMATLINADDKAWLEEQIRKLDEPLIYDQMIEEGW